MSDYYRCKECTWLDMNQKSVVGCACINPKKNFKTDTAMWKEPSTKACKLFEENEACARERVKNLREYLVAEYGSKMELIEEFSEDKISDIALASELGSSGYDLALEYKKAKKKGLL